MPSAAAAAPASGLRPDPADISWLKENKFQWIGEQGQPALGYGRVFHREGFTITEKTVEGTEDTKTYTVGTFVTVAINSRDGQKGDVSACSVAEIIGVLEDQCGHCWVALHYFWRWGQIHAGADVAGSLEGCPRVMAPKWASEVFRQAETIISPAYNDSNACNAVYGPGGRFRELTSAASLEKPVNVLPYPDVLQRYADLDPTEALDAFEGEFAEVEADTGARADGFFWRYQFDQTAYTFTYDPAAFGGSIERKFLSEEERTMADAFCGAGHVALAARMAGWAVSFGVDANADAAATFAANTMDFPGCPFNRGNADPPCVKHCTVEQLVVEAQQGQPLPKVGYLHCSPPCQELSKRKKAHHRRFTGATLMAIPKLAEVLQPAFISLEEVPGFLVHQFPRDGFLVYQEAAKQMAAQHQSQSQSQVQQRQQQQQSQPGQSQACDDEDESADDDDDAVAAAAAAGSREPAVGEVEAELQLLNQASRAAGSAPDDKVAHHPCLLVVPQLLSLGYQVRLTFLNSAQYGVPQDRVRVFLFAAKLGFALPDPPVARYQLPESSRRVLADVAKDCDPTLMPRGTEPATWWDTLTAACQALSPHDAELLPHVSVAEAVGDLPPVIASSSSSSSAHQCRQQEQGVGQQQQPPSCSQLEADGQSHLGGEISSSGHVGEQQQAGGKVQAEQQHEALSQAAARLRREALQVAERFQGRRGHQYGLQCARYQPQHGVLLQQLPQPVSHLHPVSAFAQWCRSPHWAGQGLRGFNPVALLGHTYMGPTLTLPTDGNDLMQAGGVVGTVLGHNCLCGASVHFAEPRFSTTLERRRYQSVPDWVVYCGSNISVNQQVGNAVPYLVAAEVAASVFKAATGVDGQRPPPLVGPSPSGCGLPDEARQQYCKWWDDTRWREVVLWFRDVLRPRLQRRVAPTQDDSDRMCQNRSQSSKRHKPSRAG